ncbi:MAG: hypothetical protein RL329_235 [Bacteroidota bacterium]|jgi:hypothetical protein
MSVAPSMLIFATNQDESTAESNVWAKLEIWTTDEKFAHPEVIEAPLW